MKNMTFVELIHRTFEKKDHMYWKVSSTKAVTSIALQDVPCGMAATTIL